MDERVYAFYKQAGAIARDAREYGLTLLRPGATYLSIATSIEERIRSQGGSLAFPVNIARNHLAAHYTPTVGDLLTLQEGDVVKLDVGVHINGYIADTAATAEVGTSTHAPLIQASRDALQQAIAVMHAGVATSDIGGIIERTIRERGYVPIENLMGHSVTQYELHSGLSIPNINTSVGRRKPQEGDVIAIEPFATTGSGRVVPGNGSNIYLSTDSVKVHMIRDRALKQLYDRIKAAFSTLPFAQRWCQPFMPSGLDLALRRLARVGAIREYPQLCEKEGSMVAQTEHTVLVTADGCEVLT
jgi:methionyl aminopeptidase